MAKRAEAGHWTYHVSRDSDGAISAMRLARPGSGGNGWSVRLRPLLGEVMSRSAKIGYVNHVTLGQISWLFWGLALLLLDIIQLHYEFLSLIAYTCNSVLSFLGGFEFQFYLGS